jgi:short-subunit dehydrogenase
LNGYCHKISREHLQITIIGYNTQPVQKLSFKNRWVLITGASSGLGRAIALRMVEKEEANLIITARQLGRLQELKTTINERYNRPVEVISADLSTREDVERLIEQSTDIGDIYAVINNAGITWYGKTSQDHLTTYQKIMAVNFHALLDLSLYFLSYFADQGRGALLNITSAGGLLPLPYQSVYSASKHAAQAFTEALIQENRNPDIVISSFAPGGIATEMLAKSGIDKKFSKNSIFNMKADRVARKAVNSLKKRKYLSVPGFLNNLMIFLIRFFPRKAATTTTERSYRPIENQK